MANQLAWQHSQRGLQQMRAEIALRDAQAQVAERQRAALHEVNAYREKLPALNDRKSETFRSVAAAAVEISRELGFDIQDPRVQRAALRQELGALGSLNTPAPAAPARRDATSEFQRLVEEKNIPAQQVEYWRGRGYTEKRMAEEARFYRKRDRRSKA